MVKYVMASGCSGNNRSLRTLIRAVPSFDQNRRPISQSIHRLVCRAPASGARARCADAVSLAAATPNHRHALRHAARCPAVGAHERVRAEPHGGWGELALACVSLGLRPLKRTFLPPQLDLPTLCTTLENHGREGVMNSLANAQLGVSAEHSRPRVTLTSHLARSGCALVNTQRRGQAALTSSAVASFVPKAVLQSEMATRLAFGLVAAFVGGL